MNKTLSFVIALLICGVSSRTLSTDDWWEYGHFYQIYPRSFQDSDGDGIGDLPGITSKLSHLKTIGVTATWLSPIFKSPMKDFGYDISDFRDIDPIFGTLEDFDVLSQHAEQLNIKLILDFVPNHTSDKHEWFIISSDPSHPEYEKYKDFFIWHEGRLSENGTRIPPSNWLSVFRGSAWEWNDKRQAYYLHQFLAEQPDLNYRNQAVVDEMKEVLRFWLRKGVGGFRCDTVPNLFEADVNADGNYEDEPLSGNCSDDPEASCYLNHTQTVDQEETYDMIYQWHKVLTEDEFSDFSRILMTEAYASLDNIMRYYGRVENGVVVEYGSQIPFNFDLIQNTRMWTSAPGFKDRIEEWLEKMPKAKGIHANWVLGNHDQKRLGSRYKPSRIDIFNILLKTLPGNTVTYYGEELGMTSVLISWEDTVDPQACRTNPQIYDDYSRDPGRTPMQWDGTKNAGFSTAARTWLPLANNYTENNLQLQESAKESHLKVLRKLIELRQTPTLKYGGIKLNALDDDVLVYKREIEEKHDADVYVVVLNLGTTDKVVDLTDKLGELPKKLRVVVSSINSTNLSNTVDSNDIKVPANVGLVLVGRK